MSHNSPPLRDVVLDQSHPAEYRKFSPPWQRWFSAFGAHVDEIGNITTATIATGASVSLTTNTSANVTSISLGKGSWDVSGVVNYTFGATTSFTCLKQGISTTSATLGSQDTYSSLVTAANVPAAANDMTLTTPVVRLVLGSETTVYLISKGTFTVSTLNAYGTITARKVS